MHAVVRVVLSVLEPTAPVFRAPLPTSVRPTEASSTRLGASVDETSMKPTHTASMAPTPNGSSILLSRGHQRPLDNLMIAGESPGVQAWSHAKEDPPRRHHSNGNSD